jgi:hypothetical protein
MELQLINYSQEIMRSETCKPALVLWGYQSGA